VNRLACITLAIASSTAAPAWGDPELPRLITAPTAWLPGASGFVAAAGLDMRGNATFAGDFGLGGIGEVELEVDNDARTCSAPPCGTGSDQQLATTLDLARAAFRIGAPQDAWFAGQPALVLGVRETIDARDSIGELYAVASRELGPVRLHAGIDALTSTIDGARLRPFGGVEYLPPQFRKTTLMADIAWQPIFGEPSRSLEWIGGIGVRYETFSWLTVELDVRAREGESLAGSTVLARLIAHRSPKRCAIRCTEP
jgi:hypothetical protein